MSPALFEMARFQVLSTALTTGNEEIVPNAYAYAWSKRIYPNVHDFQQIHVHFEAQFEVNKEEMDSLLTVLDDTWHSAAPMNFYQLETQMTTLGWQRHNLIYACRYFKLDGRFDDVLWNALLSNQNYPAEASLLVGEFELRSDLTV